MSVYTTDASITSRRILISTADSATLGIPSGIYKIATGDYRGAQDSLGNGAMVLITGDLTGVESPQFLAPGRVVRYTGATEARIAEQTGFIPNVDRFGNPKAVYVTPDAPVATGGQAEVVYQIGGLNPQGPTSPPTYIIIGNGRGVPFVNRGPVAGGSGIEQTTTARIPVVSVRPLPGTSSAPVLILVPASAGAARP